MALSRTHRPSNGKRRLGLESLEDRRMMAVLPALTSINTGDLPTLAPAPAPAPVVIPSLNSLQGAAKSIYLDFNGHFQTQWNRTDPLIKQTYQEVFSQPAILSEAQIRKIWETVAEDFAPFNVNVTTVEPPSFANNAAVRVVIAGENSASLITGLNSYRTIISNSFIVDTPTSSPPGYSGYSSIGSFTSAEPNVVYVFAERIKSMGSISAEGHSMTAAQVIGNTASHEAGHSFGLNHHAGFDANGTESDYDVGTSLTTPIMGENISGDRTLWSQYTSGSTTVGHIGQLNTLLSIRPDDHGNSSIAGPTQLNVGYWFQPKTATVKGVVGNFSDEDWFRFSTGGGDFKFDVKTVEFANLDAKLELYQSTTAGLTLLATVDPPTLAGKPFSGLGANLSKTLGAGTFFVAVKSHGGYGDMGNFTLTVSRNTGTSFGNVNTDVLDAQSGLTFSTTSSMTPVSGAALATGGSGGGAQASAVDAIYTSWEAPTAASWGGAPMKLAAKKADPVDAIVREKLGSGLGAGSAARIVDLAFAA
jgi:hypothetical protein